MVLGISIHFQRLGMCLQQSQLASIRAFGDQLQIWQQTQQPMRCLGPMVGAPNQTARTSPRQALEVTQPC